MRHFFSGDQEPAKMERGLPTDQEVQWDFRLCIEKKRCPNLGRADKSSGVRSPFFPLFPFQLALWIAGTPEFPKRPARPLTA